jgi:predicted phosphodiesterase
MMQVIIEQPDNGVYFFKFKAQKKVGRLLRVLNCSDIHIDSKQCDRELLKKHLDNCDFVRIYGDLFDLMQGRHDKRRSPTDLKNKYLVSAYIDEVVKDAVEFFKPYANKLLFVSLGNHETSVIHHVGTNPISAFCMLMRMHGSMVVEGVYQGFIVDKFYYDKIQTKQLKSIIYAYHHGHGGAPQKTEGTLEIEGDKAKFPNADIVLKGHNHFKWHNPGQARYWINKLGHIEKRVQHHLRLGTYKHSRMDNGWEVEKGFKPTSVGSWYIDYHVIIGDDGKCHDIIFEIISAE